VRIVKVQQKVSGSWRSIEGARGYCAIRSYISTMKKQNADVLDGLRQLFDGQPGCRGAPEIYRKEWLNLNWPGYVPSSRARHGE
jgi:hypothetical protein